MYVGPSKFCETAARLDDGVIPWSRNAQKVVGSSGTIEQIFRKDTKHFEIYKAYTDYFENRRVYGSQAQGYKALDEVSHSTTRKNHTELERTLFLVISTFLRNNQVSALINSSL